jgi:hypothetical protein
MLRLTVLLSSTLILAANMAAAPVQAAFTGVNGASAFGYYVSPYYGKLESSVVTLFCDDFENEVAFGQQWQANLSRITPGSDLSLTRFGARPNAITLYQEAAWLVDQFPSQPTASFGELQATIWRIFDPHSPAPSSDYWLLQAQDHYSSISYAKFSVVTNINATLTGPGQVQEFITPSTGPASELSTSVPEPAPFVLIGTGLMGLAFLLSRVRGKMEQKANFIHVHEPVEGYQIGVCEPQPGGGTDPS